MRKLLTPIIFALLSASASFAQNNGTGFVGNGYYRIHNFATNRYIYVTDNKDYFDKLHDSEDFQAIQLWKDPNRAISDPASVIYIVESYPGYFNLKAQGTGVREFSGYYVSVIKNDDGTYTVSSSAEGITKYLSDDRSNLSYDYGQLGTKSGSDYRKWIVDLIDKNHSINYFGVKPTISLNGKHYCPFYAAFPFKTASPGMHVYYINKISGRKAHLKEISGEVPASTPVIIECSSANTSDNRLELLNSSSAQVTDNKLSGVYFCNGDRPEESVDAYTEFNASTMRVLTVSNGKLVMTNNAPDRLKEIEAVDWTTEDDIDVTCIPANTSYLKLPASSPAVLDIVFGSGIKGDLNNDGKVDIADAVTLLNTMASGEYSSIADVNNDGRVDIADFVTILNLMAQQVQTIQGDLNNDSKVDIADAVTLLNIMASSEYNSFADVNNDGKVDIADFVSILNIMALR